MPKGSGGGGRPGRSGGGGGGGSPADAGAQMLENLRSGKLSEKDAQFMADSLLTASMKSRNFEETRAINKKYAAAMDAIEKYQAEKGTFKPLKEKTNAELYQERYGKRDKLLAKRIFGNKPVGSTISNH